MAQEHARRQLPTPAYNVLHRHGRILPAILSRTEVQTPNSVAEDAAELHKGAQGERAPPGPSHEEERDELQALEEPLNATDERWNVGGDTPVRDERQSSDSEAELAESIRQLEEKVRQQHRTKMLCRNDALLAELTTATTAVPPTTGEREPATTAVHGVGTSGTRQSASGSARRCTVISTRVKAAAAKPGRPRGTKHYKILLCRILDRCRGWLTL